MKITFLGEDLERKLSSQKGLLKAFGGNAMKILQRIDDIAATENLDALCNTAIFKCRPVAREQGDWILNISSRLSLVFEIDQVASMDEDDKINYAEVVNIKIKGIIRH
jgi:hypothetical protein